MKTECNTTQFKLHALYSREIIAKFDGGNITSDSGAFLLREVEKRTHILKRLSNCFTDRRNPKLIEHTVEALIKQRVFGIAMGYEDLNDHDVLRRDPFLGMLCEKQEPTGSDRRMDRDKGKASAGKSTLNRLELSAVTINRYKKIAPHMKAIDDLLIDLFIESYAEAPKELVFDIDKMELKREHSVVVSLGSQEVCIPSATQKVSWEKKMALIEQYVHLSPEDKKIELMRLSVQKFAHFMDTPVPRMETEDDLSEIFSWISKEAEKKQLAPETSQSDGKLDVLFSIIATVNKYFAERDFSSPVRVQSVSEYFWYSQQKSEYLYPFVTYPDELDTVIGMGLPYLDSSTLYHEVGIGCGEGLIEMIRKSFQENKVPGCIVGTDLNRYSLESIRILVQEKFGGLDNLFLRHSNAVDALDDDRLNFSPKVLVVAANRFFSILDPSVFSSVVKSFAQQMTKEGYLVAGISLLSPENLERAEMFVESDPDKYSIEKTDFGTVWYQKNPFKEAMEQGKQTSEDIVNMIHRKTLLPKESIDISRIVMQVYYDPDKFIEWVERESFTKIDRKEVENYSGREVMLFKRKHTPPT